MRLLGLLLLDEAPFCQRQLKADKGDELDLTSPMPPIRRVACEQVLNTQSILLLSGAIQALVTSRTYHCTTFGSNLSP
eukprot:1522154-Amphidinium_carterae.1